MKRIALLVLSLLMILTSCVSNSKDKPKTEHDEMRAVWISYYEYDIKNADYNAFKKKIDAMFDNLLTLNLNTVIVHMRANADALYRSEIFPWSDVLSDNIGQDPGYDPLEYMVEAAHRRDLEIHAWINPYRISNKTDDASQLPDDHIAKIWFSKEETSNRVLKHEGKLFFNPAIDEVKQLITDGVREIVDNYDVDGIHLDDYFYPTSDENFDKTTYDAYASQSDSPLSLTEWRKVHISSLVAQIYRICNAANVKLGISPAAHTGDDYLLQNGYADVERWLAIKGYADYIIPQIYWGFEYADSNYRFNNVAAVWSNYQRHNDIKLYAGLAAYKVNTEDTNNEWQLNNDILKRQVELIRENGFDGFALFSYSYIFSGDEHNSKERDNLYSILK